MSRRPPRDTLTGLEPQGGLPWTLEAPVDDTVRTALHHSQVIDLTTTGRRTGQQRRIEIFLHDKDGLLFITGMPRADRKRDWIHNIGGDPRVVVHLKQSVVADLPATARVITDPEEPSRLSRRPLSAGAVPTSRTCSSTARSSCSTSMATLRIVPSPCSTPQRHRTSHPASWARARRMRRRQLIVPTCRRAAVQGRLTFRLKTTCSELRRSLRSPA